MKRVSLVSADTLKRLLFQQGRVTLLHALAFVAVAFSYLATHMSIVPFASCTWTCGLPGVLSSVVAWWPIAASWVAVRHPGETSTSFRWWQALFMLINIAAAVGYANSDSKTLVLTHAILWSILHFALLMAIVPLAIERARKSPNTSLERTRGR